MTPHKHVYDWLDEPAKDQAESDAKRWLEAFVRPAWKKDHAWLDARKLTVMWRGSRYLCSGASTMGDVWLRKDGSTNFYDHRVLIEELSGWELTEPAAITRATAPTTNDEAV